MRQVHPSKSGPFRNPFGWKKRQGDDGSKSQKGVGLDYYTELLVKEVKESAPPLVKKECQFSEQGYEKNSRSTLTTFNALSEIEFQ